MVGTNRNLNPVCAVCNDIENNENSHRMRQIEALTYNYLPEMGILRFWHEFFISFIKEIHVLNV